VIPHRHQELAAAYLAGEISEAAYSARARDLIAQDLELDSPAPLAPDGG
jgi:hypothetical protein